MQGSDFTKSEWKEATERFGKWIHMKARKYARNLPAHVAANLYEDLVGVGFRGFVEGMRRVDPERKKSMDAYLRQLITGAMLDELRRLDPLTRDQRRKQRELRNTEQHLTRQLKRPPSHDEIAKASRRTLSEYQVDAANNNPVMVSLDAPLKNVGESLVNFVEDTTAEDPFINTLRDERRNLISNALERLPDTYQTVIKEYYYKGNTLQTIGDQINVCAARASQIRKEAVSRLRRELNERMAG